MYRNEYPRPQMVRKAWKNLNGSWDFRFEGEKWQKIEVPFVFQAPLSGIEDNRMCDCVSYKRKFTVAEEWREKQIFLHFGAVDYECKVYVNKQLAGTHIGGNVGFSLDITELLNWKNEELEVLVYDPCTDETIPRGKQFWEENPHSVWYTRSTGIWQTVWLEPVSRAHISYIKYTPDVDAGMIETEVEMSEVNETSYLKTRILFDGEVIYSGTNHLQNRRFHTKIELFSNKIFRTRNHDDGWCWSPESPNLFDVQMELCDGDEVTDLVESYFGMRKIETKEGKVFLNNFPYYQKLILDQGYWPDSLMTAKEDDDFVKDIQMAKEMGFNGCRKHQKAEDPRFLYHADRLGFLVWSEIGSCVSYDSKSAQRTIAEWAEAVNRDYNHPSIVAWVVLNESWGVPGIRKEEKQQAHSLALYYNTKSLDQSRLVVNNDGWEMTKTDICAIHNYAHGATEEKEKQRAFKESLQTKETLLTFMSAGRAIYAERFAHQGEPILLTEFGGLSYAKDNGKGWGYTTIDTDEEFLETYKRLIQAIQDSEILYGYCYTQLTDVEQEVNGLLTYDRQYKVAPECIREINELIYKL